MNESRDIENSLLLNNGMKDNKRPLAYDRFTSLADPLTRAPCEAHDVHVYTYI